MAQITHGIRRILSVPFIYDTLQNIMGARQIRDTLVSDCIQPYAGCRILDLGCGTAEILAHLPETVDYWGYDISPAYIQAAQQRYGSRGCFHCQHLTLADAEQLPKFDRVLAIGVLHHLDDEEAADFLQIAKRVLKPDGKFISIDPCWEKGQHPIARYLISKDRGQNVRDATGYQRLAQNTFQTISGNIRHRTWIPYTHWTMECRP